MTRALAILLLVFISFGCSKPVETKSVDTSLKRDPDPVPTPKVEPAPKTVEELLAELNTNDADVKKKAIADLGGLGPKAKSALPELTKILADRAAEMDQRVAAAFAVERIGPDPAAFDVLYATIKETYKADQNLLTRGIRSAIDKGKSDKESLDVFLKYVKPEHPVEIRILAIECIQRVGPDALPAVTDLKAVLLDRKQNTMVKEASAKALGEIGKDAHDAVPALIDSMKDREARVAVAAGTAFKKVAVSEESLPHLAQALADPHEATRRTVRMQMERIGEPAVPVFIECLDFRDPIRLEAATALRNLGPKSKPAERKLLRMLSADDAVVRTRAAAALEKIGVDKTSAPQLLQALEDDESAVRISCVKALATLGGPVVPDVIKRLRDHRAHVIESACDTLGMIGPPAKEAISKLTPLLADTEEDSVRSAARAALMKIDKENAAKYKEQSDS